MLVWIYTSCIERCMSNILVGYVKAFARPLVFILCLFPVLWIVYQVNVGALGPDIGKELVLATGIWALRFLLITLAITPLRKLFHINQLVKYRRMLGLYTWFYASLHMLLVLTYLLGWQWATFVEEFAERPYMAMGITAWILMVPLVLTSNRWSQRRMGRRWKTLHKLIYLIAIIACVHFAWLVRADYGEVIVYSAVLTFLLGYRLMVKYRSVSA